jgi:hypothetical protein
LYGTFFNHTFFNVLNDKNNKSLSSEGQAFVIFVVFIASSGGGLKPAEFQGPTHPTFAVICVIGGICGSNLNH